MDLNHLVLQSKGWEGKPCMLAGTVTQNLSPTKSPHETPFQILEQVLISAGLKLSADPAGKRVDITLSVYLSKSRLDIASSVGECGRFQTNPKESHLTAAKRIRN